MPLRQEFVNPPQITDLDTALERIRQLEELAGTTFETHPRYNITTTEQIMLGLLCASDRVLTREHAYTVLYGMRDDPPELKIFDVFISKLRRKLRPFDISITTIWGRGWYMEPEERLKAQALRFKRAPETTAVEA